MQLKKYIVFAFVIGTFLFVRATSDAAAQSNAYINLMRTQNRQITNRVRIYSSVRSGARITRYKGKKFSNPMKRKSPITKKRRR